MISLAPDDRYGGAAVADEAPPPLSLKELKARIAEKHEVAIGDDDPILMAFTMLQLGVEEMDRANAVHRAAMEAHVEKAATECAGAVGECMKVLRDENLESGLQMTLQRVVAQAGFANKVMGRLKWLGVGLALLTAFNWLAVLAIWALVERLAALLGK